MASRSYEGEKISEPTYTTLPAPYDSTIPDRKKRNQGIVLIVIGLAVLVIGLVFATEPLRWKSAKDIVNGWEGTADSGYYKYYDDGGKAIIIGEITDELSIEMMLGDAINYTYSELEYLNDLHSNGYHYIYCLDHIYDLELYSKSDLGEVGDEVAFDSTLHFMSLGGSDYWTWTAIKTEKPSMVSSLIIGIPLLILGLVLAGIGGGRYLAYKRGLKQR